MKKRTLSALAICLAWPISIASGGIPAGFAIARDARAVAIPQVQLSPFQIVGTSPNPLMLAGHRYAALEFLLRQAKKQSQADKEKDEAQKEEEGFARAGRGFGTILGLGILLVVIIGLWKLMRRIFS